jgi:hypothetical protein
VSGPPDVERLLERALAPVEPPADLASRVRGALSAVGESAFGELESWERAAMRAPRRWLHFAFLAGAAGAAGLLLRRRRRGE